MPPKPRRSSSLLARAASGRRRPSSASSSASSAGKAAGAAAAPQQQQQQQQQRPPFDRFERVRELGRGACGVVWLVRRRSDRRLLAMKTIGLPPLASRDEKAVAERRQALREVEILKGLESQHILSHEETVLTPPSAEHGQSELHILTEYCDAGDLAGHVRKASAGPGLTESDVWGFAAAILAGLRDLHGRRILHRDLKPANIFLKHEKKKGAGRPPSAGAGFRSRLSLGSARSSSHPGGFDASKVRVLVGDLGIARTVTSTQPLAETMVGTPLYCAPEIFEGQPYDEKADIYSYGVCVYELMHGKPPWADAQNVAGLVRHVLQLDGDPSEHELRLDPRFSEELRGVVRICMARLPGDRPTAAQLVHRIPAEHRRAVGLPDSDADVDAPAVEPSAASGDAAEATAAAAVADAALGAASADAGPPVLKGLPPRGASGLSSTPGTGLGAESPFAFRPPARSPASAAASGAGTAHRAEAEVGTPRGEATPVPAQPTAPGRCLAAMLEDALEQVPPSPVLLGSTRDKEVTLRPPPQPDKGPAPAMEREATLRPSPSPAVSSSAPVKEAAGAASAGAVARADLAEGVSRADGGGGEGGKAAQQPSQPKLASILAAACADVAGSQLPDTDDEPIRLSTASIELVASAAKAQDSAAVAGESAMRPGGGKPQGGAVADEGPGAATSTVSSALHKVSLGLISERPSSAGGERPGSRQGRGTPRPWGGAPQPSRGFGLGPVAQARACWAKWRRENQEAKVEAKAKLCGETTAVKAGGQRGSPPAPLRHGQAAPGACEGLGLEIRGVAPPSRIPKVPRPACKA